MNEEFLHYLWKFRLLNPQLLTTSGEPLVVLHPGNHNKESGPDFFNARLKIGTTTWAGNVEVHLCTSDWQRHRHHLDKAYQNIILHVVYRNDRCSGCGPETAIPTLVIKDQFPENILQRYQQMMKDHQWIPCYNLLKETNLPEFDLWSTSLAVERLMAKSENMKRLWNSCANDWEEAFYRFLARNFGFRINALPFELLSKSLPLKVLKRHKGNRLQLEALLFGQAGMLEAGFRDAYPMQLYQEYRHLADKYRLRPLLPASWKYLRLRPSNFPTIRISQFAATLADGPMDFFDSLVNASFVELCELFSLKASAYWDDHYLFDRASRSRPKILGRSSVALLVINAIAPFLFFYGLEKGESSLREKALNLLESVPGEMNSDIQYWKQTGLPHHTALQTQSLIQLKQCYCDSKLCLECRIGIKLLKSQ